MQILVLDPLNTFILDVIAWILFHLGIAYFSSKIPVEHFDINRRFYRSFP